MVIRWLMIAMLMVVSGCATTGAGAGGHGPSTDTQKVLLQQAAGIAVDHFVADNPQAQDRVDRIRTIVQRVRALSSTTTVEELRAAIDVEVGRLGLSPLELKDSQRFLTIMQAVLTDYIGGNQLDAKGLVKVDEFLGWIEAALPLPLPAPIPGRS